MHVYMRMDELYIGLTITFVLLASFAEVKGSKCTVNPKICKFLYALNSHFFENHIWNSMHYLYKIFTYVKYFQKFHF